MLEKNKNINICEFDISHTTHMCLMHVDVHILIILLNNQLVFIFNIFFQKLLPHSRRNIDKKNATRDEKTRCNAQQKKVRTFIISVNVYRQLLH